MIYEIRTYTFAVGGVAEFERGFSEKIAQRNKYSKLGAFWKTEFGPLNQAIHIWPYKDFSHRAEVREAAQKAGDWPPQHNATILDQEAEIFLPLPFMEPWGEDREMGKFYEMRIYDYAPGSMPEVIKRWEKAIPCRLKHSPLAACWHAELGTLTKFIHVWPYDSVEQRAQVRAAALKEPDWPPDTLEFLVRQEIKIVTPAPFSPMR